MFDGPRAIRPGFRMDRVRMKMIESAEWNHDDGRPHCMRNVCKLWRHRLPLALAFLQVCISTSGILNAGVLLTRAKQAEIGTVVESENAVSFRLANGAANFPKNSLLWYSTESDIDTLLKAARRAKADGNNEAAMILYLLSAERENATKAQSLAEWELLNKTLLAGTAAQTPGVASAPAIEASLGAEEKIARGRQMIQNGKETLAKSHMPGFSEGLSGAGKSGTGSESIANRNIAEGERLVAEGEKELAERQARQEAEAARQREAQEVVAQSHQAIQGSPHMGEWTTEEKMANAGAAGVFILVVLAAVWQITMKESKV